MEHIPRSTKANARDVAAFRPCCECGGPPHTPHDRTAPQRGRRRTAMSVTWPPFHELRSWLDEVESLNICCAAPRHNELAASEVADSTAFDHPGAGRDRAACDG